MRSTTILSLISLMTMAQAFVIPEDQAPGAYLVTRHSDGYEEHIKVEDDGTFQMPADTVLEKRENQRWWCGCGIGMNSGQCDTSVQKALDGMSNGVTILAGNSYYWHNKSAGSVVAFICNKGSRAQRTYPQDLSRALASITDRCGRYTPGTFHSNETYLNYGYMNWHAGLDFCKASTASNSHRC